MRIRRAKRRSDVFGPAMAEAFRPAESRPTVDRSAKRLTATR